MTTERNWYMYLLRCSDGTVYTGITTDVGRRLHEHNHTKKGARYTRGRRPVVLIGSTVAGETRGEAQSAERRVKGLPRKKKIQLAEEWGSVKVGRQERLDKAREQVHRDHAETFARLAQAPDIDLSRGSGE